jgi:micrococcal nuclease
MSEKSLIAPLLILVLLAIAAPCRAGAPGAGESAELGVEYVYDGDTVRLSGGLVVRYIGIDTPEKGEAFYDQARRRNIELVGGKSVRIVVCRDEPTDKYGRTLGWVWVDGVLVNGVLLKEGLAKSLIIPPCGLERVEELKGLESEAKKAGLGIWR